MYCNRIMLVEIKFVCKFGCGLFYRLLFYDGMRKRYVE